MFAIGATPKNSKVSRVLSPISISISRFVDFVLPAIALAMHFAVSKLLSPPLIVPQFSRGLLPAPRCCF